MDDHHFSHITNLTPKKVKVPTFFLFSFFFFGGKSSPLGTKENPV
jgi:hypothetical protein